MTKAGVPADQCLYCSEDLVETLAAQRTDMKAARLIPPPGSDLSKLEACACSRSRIALSAVLQVSHEILMNEPRSIKTKFLSVLVTALVTIGWQQSALAAEKVYQEVGGLLVMENESGPYAPPFVAATAKPGYTGSSYITWAGAGVTNWPYATEDFPYAFKFNITHPGRYYFVVHNWIATPYCSFFAQLDGIKQTTHHFSYSYIQQWNWQTWNDTGAGGPIHATQPITISPLAYTRWLSREEAETRPTSWTAFTSTWQCPQSAEHKLTGVALYGRDDAPPPPGT